MVGSSYCSDDAQQFLFAMLLRHIHQGDYFFVVVMILIMALMIIRIMMIRVQMLLLLDISLFAMIHLTCMRPYRWNLKVCVIY